MTDLALIERALDAGLHDLADAAIVLLDELEGDADLESEPGEADWRNAGLPSHSVPVYDMCKCCGHLERIKGEWI